jgi:hypothetical protein
MAASESPAVEPWKQRILEALEAADDRPYVLVVIDVALPVGVPVLVSGPVYWLKSNMTTESVAPVMRSVATKVEERESAERIKATGN